MQLLAMRWALALLPVALCVAGLDAARAANAQPPYQVDLRVVDAGLEAEFRLGSATDEFRFDALADEIRARSWSVITCNLVLDQDSIRSRKQRKFSRFTLLIRPDPAGHDQPYPVLQRVGADGYLLYTPHLLTSTMNAAPQIRVRLRRGLIALAGGGKHPKREPLQFLPTDRYVFIGPIDYVSLQAHSATVAPPEMPAWLTLTAINAMEHVVTQYAQRLDERLSTSPLLVLQHSDEGADALWRGDTTPGYTISLRFSGSAWRQNAPPLRAIVTSFIAHEAFHFWNGEAALSRDSATQPWLHEGSAEYAAESIGMDGREPGPAPVMQQLEECRSALQDAPLAGQAGRSGLAPYSCGALLFRVADHATKPATESGFFELWRRILQRSRAQGGVYGVNELRDLLAGPHTRPEATEIFDLILGGGADRWQTIAQDLHALGIE